MRWLILLRFIRPTIRHPVIAVTGFQEGTCSNGVTFDDDPYSDRSVAYDVGRTLRAGVEA